LGGSKSKESARDSWYQSLESGVIISSPDLRSEVVRAVDSKDAPKPHREKSRNVMMTLEARLAKMEFTVANKLEVYDERIEKLESVGNEFQEEMQSALNSVVDMLQQGNTSLR